MQYDQMNLASSQLGASIVFATDEWFAAADNLLSDPEPVWKQDLYTSYGKWMDGWESRRRRTEGHDWSIIKLGFPGSIKAIEVDTAYFTGNFSPKISIYGTNIDESDENYTVIKSLIDLRESSIINTEDHSRIGLCATEEEANLVFQLKSDTWSVLVPLTPLGAGYEETRKTLFPISSSSKSIFTYLRINMGPDGGIARIRVYGDVIVKSNHLPIDKPFDLIAIQYGGQAVSWSNKHYGHPRNLMAPGRGTCMGDGWETARQPTRPAIYQKGPDGLMLLPGYDWTLLKLGVKGIALYLEVDTHYYKGNYPESCMILACNLNKDYSNEELNVEDVHNQIILNNGGWKVLLPRTRLHPNQIHHFNIDTMNNNTNNTITNHQEAYLNNSVCSNISNSSSDIIGPITHIKLIIYPDGGIMRLRLIGHKFLESKL